MRSLSQDLRYGIRILRGSFGFTFVAVLTLALAIGANTAVFSWLDTILMRPLPGVEASVPLVILESLEPNGEGHNISYADYRDYRDSLKLSQVALHLIPNALSLGEGEHTRRVWGELVTGNFFDLLGIKPMAGRFFNMEERGDKYGAYPVAVISERLWRDYFNANPAIIGKTVRVNQNQLTVIGIAPAAFFGGMRGLLFDIWIPLTMGPQLNIVEASYLNGRRPRMHNGLARLNPGVTIEQARAEITAVASRLAAAYPDSNRGYSATLYTESESHAGVRSLLSGPLRILMAMCLVVLLIACVNVANLLLARATVRQKEFSIRLALGAGRGRLARQLLTESLLIAAIGALFGIPLALWMQQSLGYLAPASSGFPIGLDIQMNPAALVFTLVLCVAAALFSGLSPALHAVRHDVNESLKEGGRSGTAAAKSHRLRGLFVISEVALALVAIVGAGLFIRSFTAARAINPGFDSSNVLVARCYVSTAGYSGDQRKQFALDLRNRLATAPGVVAASDADTIPLGFGLGAGTEVQVEGYVPDQNENMTFGRTLVGPGYFSLLRMPLLDGRDFTAQDDAAAPPVIIVNEAFARRFFAGANPVGRRVRALGRWSTVVGLVKDTKYYTLVEPRRPYLFAPLQQGAGNLSIAMFVRTAGDSAAVIPILRRESSVAIDVTPLSEYIAAPLFPYKTAASLLSVLGLIALILAAVGLYSVMAYAVTERTREIGIRMALGAHTRDILTMVLRKGMALTGAGLLIGLAAALGGARLIAGMLTNISTSDPVIFTAAALFLAAVALLASLLPAVRAACIEPMKAVHEA